MSLLDACPKDVRDSLLVKMELQGLQSGSTTTGQSPSFADHTRENYQREADHTKRLAPEMFAADQADILLDCSQPSIFSYFYLIAECTDKIMRELDASPIKGNYEERVDIYN